MLPVSRSLPVGVQTRTALCVLLSALFGLWPRAGGAVSGPIAPASGQPVGALSGRIVFTSAGHGWTFGTTTWGLQRPVLVEMNEDYGNLDQMTMFAFYCFNAGATVVTMRPVGHQTNEVVLDNVSAGVTFSGGWTANTTGAVYYGTSSTDRYRTAPLSATETATATYTPNIPMAGFYPVYAWASHDTNRTSQLYKINHTGGQAHVRVPHHMVGNGWVYLGTYYFNAGSSATSGSVQISNLQPTPAVGSLVIADAIRFGNGMASIDRGGGISRYPREEECSRYWVQNSFGQGQPIGIYDVSGGDSTDNVGTPPRMAQHMNHEVSGNMYKRIYIGFHSNATTGDTNTATARGTVGLYNTDTGIRTPNQFRLAQIIGREVTDDLVAMNALLEYPWYDRGSGITYGSTFGEINNNYITNEFDATIIEVAFHDNVQDAILMRDPKVRNWVARACYHSVVKYMNEFDGLALNFLPEPPYNVRAIAGTNGITVSWSTPSAQAGSGAATGYVVYSSTNGYGFGNPTGVSGGGTTSVTLTNLAADTDYYFRVAATNAGGESFPSETVGCRRSSNPAAFKVLVVNAFDRFDRTTNLRQTPTALNYVPPGNSGTMERVIPRSNNAFDYVVQHGKAISAFGMAFDSCQKQAVTNGQVSLNSYPVVIWSSGQSLTNTFRSTEQGLITTFLGNGRALFVSGSEIAWDLDRASGPSPADRAFLNNQLHADLGSDSNNNSQSYSFTPAGGSIFVGNANGSFDDGTKNIYWVKTPDVLTPVGTGAQAAMNYVGGIGGAAAIQYDGSAAPGRVVYFGFPFETITSSSVRNAYMADILTFLTPVLPSISAQPQSQTVNQGGTAVFNVTATGTAPLRYQWRFNGTNLAGATTNSYTRTNAQPGDAGDYAVVVTNIAGSVTSAVATLTVLVPPAITAQPQSQTVTQGVSATFAVTAGGTPPLSYQWRFEGTNIAGATTSSFTRTNAQPGDAGNYSVVVTNAAGLATSSNAVLTVLVPPTITAQPQSETAKVGSNVTFTVTAVGTAPLAYQWRFNGTNLAGATTNFYTVLNVQTNDAGSYSVTVTNVAGSVTSSNAVLTVLPLQPLQFELISLLPDGRAQLVLSAEPGTYLLEESANLFDWAELTSLTNTNSLFEFIDDSATNQPTRYYRAQPAP